MPLSTRGQILKSAEILFSQKGFNGVGVREITQHAGVNLAAIHYHFGSKEDLFVEMVRRVVDPLNDVRLRRIAAIMEADPKPPFRDLIAALIEPMVEAMEEGGELQPHRIRMAARAHIESAEVTRLMHDRLFADVKNRFSEAVSSYFPEVPKGLIAGRVFLTVSLFIGTMAQTGRIETIPPGNSCSERTKHLWMDMIDFVAAGFSAPYSTATGDTQ